MKLKKDCVSNTTRNIKVLAPNKNALNLTLKNENIVLDRSKFDQYIAEKAMDRGVKFHLQHKFMQKKNKTIIIQDIKNRKTKEFKTHIIIGADGPLSAVAKSCNMFGKRRFWTGLQAVIKNNNSNTIQFYPHIGAYAWIVPENADYSRIGVVARKNTKSIFDKFIYNHFKKSQIISRQAGTIPEYNPKIMTQSNNTYLIGDAGTMVKATTGGGIIPGFASARALCDSIISNKDYESQWRKMIGRELWIHLFLRKMMDRFSMNDWNRLIELTKKENCRRIIELHDREHPSRFLFRLFLQEPRYSLFLKHALNAL